MEIRVTASKASEALRHNLRRLRAEADISQAELARRSGVSRPILSALEQGRGNPSLNVLESIARALGCEAAELLRSSLIRATNKAQPWKGQARYSPSGRKPSFLTWLSHPPAWSKTAKARDFGVDLSLLVGTLRLTPKERLRRAASGAATLRALRNAKRLR